MPIREKIFLLSIVLAVLFKLLYSGLKDGSKSENQSSLAQSENQSRLAFNHSQIQKAAQKTKNNNNSFNQKIPDCSIIKNIKFIRTDNKGNDNEQGVNHVIIFDPKSKDLDFKVSLGLFHKLYDKDDKGKFRKGYIPRRFNEIIFDKNSTLNGKRPIAAINGDYIDNSNKPEGLNISRGVEYSGVFKDKRSSFGISAGKPEERRATIQIGKRQEELLNYNLVGGNGRFYNNGKFKDICQELGDYICSQEISRSMVAITSKGYVIFLVNNANLEKALYPSMFDDVLEGIAANRCLGNIQEGMLFDGGFSTGLYFNNKIYVQNPHPIGSVFLIYKTDNH
jgi:hypothetical protein